MHYSNKKKENETTVFPSYVFARCILRSKRTTIQISYYEKKKKKKVILLHFEKKTRLGDFIAEGNFNGYLTRDPRIFLFRMSKTIRTRKVCRIRKVRKPSSDNIVTTSKA